MNRNGNLIFDAREVLRLEDAIDHWLAARDRFKLKPNVENQNEYNVTYFGLGTAFS